MPRNTSNERSLYKNEQKCSFAISLVSTKKPSPLSISDSGCSLYACLEIVIEIEGMRATKPEPGFSGSKRKRASSAEEIGSFSKHSLCLEAHGTGGNQKHLGVDSTFKWYCYYWSHKLATEAYSVVILEQRETPRLEGSLTPGQARQYLGHLRYAYAWPRCPELELDFPDI